MQKLVFRNGAGNKIDLTAGNFGITNWAGLSNTPLNIQTQQVPFEDGGVFLDALMEQREIDLTVAIQDNNDLELRYQLKRELISALNPKLGEGVLIYTNDHLSKQIHAVPQIPLFENKNSNDKGTLKASVAFSCPSPYWEDVEETEVDIKMGELVTVNNAGDVPTQMEIQVLSSDVTNPRIQNVTNGKKIELSGQFDKNVYINTNIGKKRVYSEVYKANIAQAYVNMNNMCYSNVSGLFLGVANGVTYYSYDGKNWDYVLNDLATNINSICYSEELNLFVAVGSRGKLITSNNGFDWSQVDGISSSYFFYDIIYIPQRDLFVIAGDQVYTSPDGMNWTAYNTGVEAKSVVYNSYLGVIVAVGNVPAQTVGKIVTSTYGTTWNVSSDYSYNLKDICYNPTTHLLVATGGNGYILTSSDATGWTSRSSGTTEGLNSVTYVENAELYIAVGDNSKIITSTNGTSWTTQTSGITNTYSLTNVFSVDTVDVIIATGYLGYILTSQNGINWTDRTPGVAQSLNGVTYSEKLKLFVAVGVDGTILTSSDGKDWTTQNIGFSTTNDLLDIIYVEELNLFIAVGEGIYTSPDGINWTRRSTYTVRSVVYAKNKGLLVAVGNACSMTSTNGTTWARSTNVLNKNLYGVTYSEELEKFIAVGDGGAIIKSYDGIEWFGTVGGGQYNVNSVCYSKELGLFVAVGELFPDGAILTSDVGEVWKVQVKDIMLSKIIFVDLVNMFFCLSSVNKIITSSDAFTWEELTSVVGSYGICYSTRLSRFVTVGSGGSISYSSFDESINQIDKITSDSNMSFNLEMGKNQLRINKSGGTIFVRVKYRQKYIGV